MKVKVGILRAVRIEFSLSGSFTDNFGRHVKEGSFVAELSDDAILFDGRRYDELYFRSSGGAVFVLDNVVIGKDFHWQQKRRQRFGGDLQILRDGDELVAVNHIDMEQYLYSVIASEMSSTSFLELLKAHAVISRSWVVSAINGLQNIPAPTSRIDDTNLDNPVYVRWYERDAHSLFHVCADDHCQRYQGITKETNAHVVQAVNETFGEVLLYDDEICDARFSKSCGGVVEEYQYCWENLRKPYLVALRDAPETDMPDLTNEAQAEQWILTNPESYCNTHDPKILSQVLNDYDQETKDFYRWQVEYTQSELRHLIESKLNLRFGDIIDLQPVERGMSGRLSKLRVVGTERTLIIGKELEIRRALSPSHLYSSAFVVQRFDLNAQQVPARFVLKGAGWGHGVGLCQIGAAVMGERGFRYDEILLHYYRGVEIRSIYSKA